MVLTPTQEQWDILGLVDSCEDGIVEALAGAGKTSLLNMIARRDTRLRGHYLAFNRALVDDAARLFPRNIVCKGIHQRAFAVTGRRFAHRLNNGSRMRARESGRRVGILGTSVPHRDIDNNGREHREKVLGVETLTVIAQQALRTFCQSGDLVPDVGHFAYIDGIDDVVDGVRQWENNRIIQRYLLPAVEKMWEDWKNPDGWMRYDHMAYLKLAQLEGMFMPGDLLLVDEAQDLSGVMIAIINQQKHMQRILVGDSCQAIYEWMGSINALTKVDVAWRAALTQSFRFGPDIADSANRVLEMISNLRLRGCDKSGYVGRIDQPNAIMCRTNATALMYLMNGIGEGRRVHMVGGGGDLVRFAEGAARLQDGERSEHPDLACFEDWHEVQQYVEDGEDGGDLRLMVKLIDQYGTNTIIDTIKGMVSEDRANLCVSTTHKVKGRGWSAVKVAGDFTPVRRNEQTIVADLSVTDKRLLYVAMTRAMDQLDIDDVAWETDVEEDW